MIGNTIGDYRIIEKRGEGGMGMFFKAQDIRLDRYVGIKTIRAELLHEPDILAKLEEEAKSLARLDHPNIARLLHYMVINDLRYIVMEYVEGADLAELMRRDGPLPLELVAQLVPQICSAIGYAHDRGVIHRDIKPSNILLTSDHTAKVTDFGIAKILGVSTKTKTGVATGSLPYMAPEQIRGTGVDARTDIYQLGVMFFELLVGRRPFLAETEYDMMSHHLSTPPPAPSSIDPKLPKSVDRVLLKALAKNPEDRFASTAALSLAFSQAVSGMDESRTVFAQIPLRKSKPRRLAAVLMGGVVLALLVAFALLKGFWFDDNKVSRVDFDMVSVSVRGVPPPSGSPTPRWKAMLYVEYLIPGTYNVVFEGGGSGKTDGGTGGGLSTQARIDSSGFINYRGLFQSSDSVRIRLQIVEADSMLLYEGQEVITIQRGVLDPEVEIELQAAGREIHGHQTRSEIGFVRVLVATAGMSAIPRDRNYRWLFGVRFLGHRNGRFAPLPGRTPQSLSPGQFEWTPIGDSGELFDTLSMEPGDSVRFYMMVVDDLGREVATSEVYQDIDRTADLVRVEIPIRFQDGRGSAPSMNLTLDVQPFTERDKVNLIWVDGQKQASKFPLELRADPGRRTVRWQIGNDIWTDTVTVGATPVEKHLIFEKSRGRVNVTVTFPDGPGYAEILLDGQETGQGTPGELRNVAAGPHEITLRREGYQMQGGPYIVRVPANDRARIDITMAPRR